MPNQYNLNFSSNINVANLLQNNVPLSRSIGSPFLQYNGNDFNFGSVSCNGATPVSIPITSAVCIVIINTSPSNNATVAGGPFTGNVVIAPGGTIIIMNPGNAVGSLTSFSSLTVNGSSGQIVEYISIA